MKQNTQTSKQLIILFLAGKTFENSAIALAKFKEEHSNLNPSKIYFYRVFAEHAKVMTKRERVLAFIKEGNFTRCKEAYCEFAVGEDKNTSLNYFTQIYTIAMKDTKKVSSKKKETITLSTLTAKAVISKVKEVLKVEIKLNPKNKQAILKEATKLLSATGHEVL